MICRMVDEQIFIEVGKRWVEMMMDPGKNKKNPPAKSPFKIREIILSVKFL